jgi:hypothetical protein|tara:strand:+ start:557 stop:787 length:231 start_codon:yes stop_codon:yes gene_type:complete
MKKSRDYKREYATYHSTKEQKKRRAQRNKARRQAIREGRVKKYSKKDVHHKDKNTANNKKSNLRILSRKKNRSKKI